MSREPTEMETRVAKVLYDLKQAGQFSREAEHYWNLGVRSWYFDQARAAIRAMREPTGGMLAAVDESMHPNWLAHRAYEVMIDAASPPNASN